MDAAQAPASDDQELAKVLESMNNSVSALPTTDGSTDPSTNSGLQFEETPPADPVASEPVVSPVVQPEPVVPPLPPVQADPAATTADVGDLESIKQNALHELRPLVDKLDLPAEEKFNTLLLIIRSTDDRSLVTQAYDAAKAIEDESKRAEALLDVIKEIDYFSHPAS